MHTRTISSALVALLSFALPAIAQNVTLPVLTHAFTAQVAVGKPGGPILLNSGADITEGNGLPHLHVPSPT